MSAGSEPRPPIVVPDAARRRALDAGPAGRAWLEALPALVARVEHDWGLRLERVFDGGTESFVALVRLADGEAGVLKLAIPGAGSPTRAMHVLRQADGRGYARLLRHDESGEAMLLEALGGRLADLGWPVPRQLEAVCATLEAAWRPPEDPGLFPTGAEKAEAMAGFIADLHRTLAGAASDRAVRQALDFCERRRRAWDPARAVLAHADAHSMNTLADPHREGAFKFVDPEGLYIEREYDLAIPMREWGDELLAGDPVALGRARCRFLADRLCLDEEAIWQWGVIERLATGLLLVKLGLTDWARPFLAVSEAWAAAGT
ncbi:MAG TPA: aminoglycoside phosphotransferase family protein [Caulobacteraceae bacterium]|nr:aminoglycoside phosphotransferase family protein [Caulobacteraceae bacterium]